MKDTYVFYYPVNNPEQSGAVFSEGTPQEEHQPGPSRQSNNLVEPSNDESSDEEEHDGTTCKFCEFSWIELMKKCGD